MTTPWWDNKLAAFDCETTGVDVFNDRIVTAALVQIRPGARPKTFGWLINPGIEIPQDATDVHGISTQMVKARGADPAVALFEVTAALAYPMSTGIPVIAMNAAYDLTILEEENHRHNLPCLKERLHPRLIGPVIDPFVLDKHVDPYRKGGRKLTDLCRHYGVTLAGAHSSAGDALAAARVATVICRRYDDLSHMSLTELHEAQVGWRRQQQDSLRAYFDKKGTVHDGCDGHWPIQQRAIATQEALT